MTKSKKSFQRRVKLFLRQLSRKNNKKKKISRKSKKEFKNLILYVEDYLLRRNFRHISTSVKKGADPGSLEANVVVVEEVPIEKIGMEISWRAE